ncbi:glyoxalase/bleomycin resistance/extradiol dioxygenase family protein [Aquiflexum gelatinilyticum]|uniref:Glyoxalase/bleomycin resistance/extradiol dioxygenase family protein n=1 Tax=Aquiflexum gelatinilyticum TaxID=2961943 RepID=A0A9X2T182_9BACT|nr:glyoxalase/bleomycin resistance/extradiol dioxygenase family protein [Aquiflexum gelatinilyticum]MCR9014390.1 glyoxalase/bleomycin resistance/extradiol dioxygenase family protein [Aquiflexum gelatinilyticum]MCS4435763.1 glyoxalase/bleomycin resistance/extradiol dioxygenase family protein [Aquiflexum gelatinilyticum]
MKQIFINLPVQNLEESQVFYTQLGFSIDPLFSDNQQKCMVWSEQIYVMLQTMEVFRLYNRKTISDPKTYINASFTLPVEGLDQVNEILNKGLEAGGKEPIPMIDEGYMQIRRIEDLDGHTWDIIYLDRVKFSQNR